MKEIVQGTLALTLDMKAGDIYPIEYQSVSSVNIVNYTDDSLFVSSSPDFEFNNNVGNFLTIASNNAYNEYVFFKSGKNTLYIKAISDGYVSIVRKQW